LKFSNSPFVKHTKGSLRKARFVAEEFDFVRFGLENLAVLPLNGKPDIGTLARFNESCLLEHDLHAFKVFEKPLSLTKQDRHNANLQFIHNPISRNTRAGTSRDQAD